MGKVLLELQPNKRDLLPVHKFAPRDVVILIKKSRACEVLH